MSLPLTVMEYAPCPHRHAGQCVRAVERLGVTTPVTPLVCNVTCRNLGGPYGGGPAGDEDAWLASMLRMTSTGSVGKVVTRYGTAPVSIVVPDVAARVREAFAFLADRPWFGGVGLSGSAIVAGAEPRDLDAVIFATDLRAYMTDRPTLTMPTSIDGRKLDVFVKPRAYHGPFAVLDVTDAAAPVLYASGLYRIGSVPPGVAVARTRGERYAPPQPAVAHAAASSSSSQPTGVAWVARGAVGLAKAIAGVGVADDATIERRRATCRDCKSNSGGALLETCNECGCVLRAKTRLADERCPLGKW